MAAKLLQYKSNIMEYGAKNRTVKNHFLRPWRTIFIGKALKFEEVLVKKRFKMYKK